MLQILLLILLISQRSGRNLTFWKSVSARISEFFDLHRRSTQDTDASYFRHLGLGKIFLHGYKFKSNLGITKMSLLMIFGTLFLLKAKNFTKLIYPFSSSKWYSIRIGNLLFSDNDNDSFSKICISMQKWKYEY